MKKHIALLFLSLGFFTACDMVSGEGEGADNAVYMGNTNSSGVISMVVSNDKGGSSVITPRLANITAGTYGNRRLCIHHQGQERNTRKSCGDY